VLEMQIAPSAFGPFYGTPFSLLVGAEVYEHLADLLPAAATVFILQEDGLICLPPSAKDRDLASISPMQLEGMAFGLKAFIVGTNRSAEAGALIAYCKEQGMAVLPAVHEMPLDKALRLPGSRSNHKTQATAFLANVLAEHLKSMNGSLGTTQQQLATLRQRYERLWLSHEKAQRMIRGVGFNLRNICFSLTPGSASIGANNADPEQGYHQRLPVDLAGLAGIHLFVTKAAAKNTKGNLTVRIRRCADKALIGDHTVAYSVLAKGWAAFEFPDFIADTYGDGLLEVSWSGEGGPLLALADVQADRYGDDGGQTLALRIEKGLKIPSLDAGKDSVVEEVGPSKPDMGVEPRPVHKDFLTAGQKHIRQIRAQRVSELAGDISFYQGPARLAQLTESLGFAPMTVSEETGSLQTHPFEGGVSAAILQHGLPIGATRLSCEVGTAHAFAPEFTYILAVLPRDVEPVSTIDKIIEFVKSGEFKGSTSETGTQWCSKTLSALETSVLAMDLIEIPSQTASVVFAAISPSGTHSYGWCRWYSYAVSLADAGAVRHALERPVKKPVAAR